MFLAVNADNLADFDLRVVLDAHRDGGAITTLSLFHAPIPSNCWIVDIEDGRVVGYVEKLADPPSDLVNAGMYAFHSSALDVIAGPPPKDIGYDPATAGRPGARRNLDGCYFIDIGTATALARARNERPARRAS
jgi:mannose-1-phosphate guanylyltransferase